MRVFLVFVAGMIAAGILMTLFFLRRESNAISRFEAERQCDARRVATMGRVQDIVLFSDGAFGVTAMDPTRGVPIITSLPRCGSLSIREDAKDMPWVEIVAVPGRPCECASAAIHTRGIHDFVFRKQ